MKILHIGLNRPPARSGAPAAAKRRRAYARNPVKTVEDPVFKASEVRFYAPDFDNIRPVLVLHRENGKLIREGYVENVRYLTVDGKELAEFTCSPTAESNSPNLFRVLVEAECIERQVQKRTVKQENPV